MAIKDTTMIGKKFGRLLIQYEVRGPNSTRYVVALCDCGTVKEYYLGSITGKRTLSCGCLKREVTGNLSRRHSHAVDGLMTGAYRSWRAMKQRCFDSGCSNYQHYGARGITVCERWMNFSNFFEDMGSRPYRQSLDRIDNSGNYELSNCKWSTFTEQANNTSRSRVISFDGKSLTISQWSVVTGIGESRIRKRIDALKWSIARALTTTTDARS